MAPAYRRLPTAERVVVECCPGSVLKRLGLPHQNYKQPTGGPLTRKRDPGRDRAVRAGRRPRPPGGGAQPRADALDAVIAAFGAALAVEAADHRAIARHPRYPREGHLCV